MTKKDQDDLVQEELFPNAGALLKEARRKARLSIEDVAKELHLEGRIIEALENEDEALLPSRVFTLGYLKKYARLLNLSEAEVLDASRFAAEADEAPALTLNAPPEIHPQTTSSHVIVKTFTWLIVIALIALLIMWWQGFVKIPGASMELLPELTEESGAIIGTEESATEAVPLEQTLFEAGEILDIPVEETVPEEQNIELPGNIPVDNPPPQELELNEVVPSLGSEIVGFPAVTPIPEEQETVTDNSVSETESVSEGIVMYFKDLSWVEVRNAAAV